MKIIRIFSDFCDSKQLMDASMVSDRLLSHSEYYGKQYMFTINNDYTHVILVNKAMPNVSHLPKENIIGIAAEPPAFLGITSQWIEYIQRTVSVYYIGDATGLPEPFTEKYGGLPWHCPLIDAIPHKTNKMSMVVSFKKMAPGHHYRHQFVRAILSDPSLPIDIYGNGCSEYGNDPRIKGSFQDKEPYELYQYHICIENFSLPEYFSEKISNAMIYGCTPIYYGCTNISRYFPNSVICLSGCLEEDLQMIRRICNSQEVDNRRPVDRSHLYQTISIETVLSSWLEF